MNIRRATPNDVNAVVTIHVAAFPRFFLTSLGNYFLTDLYRGFLGHPSGIFYVADDGSEVIGFVAGTSEPAAFFEELRKQRGLLFLAHALPAVLRNPVIVARKLYGALFYRGDGPTETENGALLSSIAVLPDALGKRVGKELLQKFEEVAFSGGAKFVYLTTDQDVNDQVNAFYKKCGYEVEGKFLQQGKRPMLRYMKMASAAGARMS